MDVGGGGGLISEGYKTKRAITSSMTSHYTGGGGDQN